MAFTLAFALLYCLKPSDDWRNIGRLVLPGFFVIPVAELVRQICCYIAQKFGQRARENSDCCDPTVIALNMYDDSWHWHHMPGKPSGFLRSRVYIPLSIKTRDLTPNGLVAFFKLSSVENPSIVYASGSCDIPIKPQDSGWRGYFRIGYFDDIPDEQMCRVTISFVTPNENRHLGEVSSQCRKTSARCLICRRSSNP